MRRHPAMLLPVLLVMAAAATLAKESPPPAQETQLAVAEAVITTEVVDRQAADNVVTVAADVGEVYCWSRIVGAEGEIEIEHVWYRGDEEMARVLLRVGTANWRTWSSKKIEPDWTGDWRVDIVGPDGLVLESVSFTVG